MELKSKQQYIILFVIAIFTILTIATLLINHNENDEVVYQTLAKKLSLLKPYNLQNSDIIKILPKNIYDTQIFFRPPIFTAFLATLYLTLGETGLKLTPVMIYLILCIAIYKTAFAITKSKHSALKALLLSIFSSLFLFSSVKIHLDLFMILMVTIALFLLVLFEKRGQRIYIIASGGFFVLATLTNYTSAILYPFFLTFLLLVKRRGSFLNMALFLLPSLILLLWFYYLTFIQHMSLSFLISSPNHEMIATFPFINYVYNRPFYFYFINILLTNPLYLFLIVLFKKNVRNDLIKRYKFFPYFLLSIIITILTVLTIFGIAGGTYQMRYILLAEPFFIILLTLIPFSKIHFLYSLSGIFILHNLLLGFINLSVRSPELYNFFEISKFLSH